MKAIVSAFICLTLTACSGGAEQDANNAVSNDINSERSSHDGPAANVAVAAPDSTQGNVSRFAPNDREQPEPAPAASIAPSYDSDGYCAEISEAAGGSYVIEKTCREQEDEALSRIQRRTIPDRVARYCDSIGEAAGGSYVIYNTCVDQELEAASGL